MIFTSGRIWENPKFTWINLNFTLCLHVPFPNNIYALGVVAKWSKVLKAVPLPFMVWSTLALGAYQLRFLSWVFHVIFSFVHFISVYTLGGLRAFRKPLLYNIYVFNLRIANHILIIKIEIMYHKTTWIWVDFLCNGHMRGFISS